jgi:4-amino-4-deoxy-L-arabinose transferase-like glycosyltransferase
MPSGSTIKSPVFRIAAIVALSLALNLAFFFSTPPEPPKHDALSYDIIARYLVGYGPADKPPSENREIGLQGLFRRGLAFPVFLGAVYRVAGSPSYTAACLIQGFILPLTVFLTFLFGRVVFSDNVGLLAALLYALYLPAVWHTNFLLTETVLALVVTAGLWLLALFLKRRGRMVGIAAGIVLGIAGISHPIWLVMPLLILGALYWQYRRDADRWIAVRKLGYVLVGVAVVFVPWTTARVFLGVPQLGGAGSGFGAGGGFTFYAGSRVETRGLALAEDYLVAETYFPLGKLRELYERVEKGEVTIEPILLAIIEEKLASPDKNDWTLTDFDYYRAGIENWFHKPLRVPELLAYKFNWYLLHIATSPSYPLPHNLFHNPAWRTLFHILNWPGVALAIAGLVITYRKSRNLTPLFAPAVFHTIAVLATYPDNRYKYPNLSAGFVLIAFTLPVVIGWTRAQWKRAAGDRAA